MHQIAPSFTNLHQIAPNRTNVPHLHQTAQVLSNCTKLHQSSPSCTNLRQSAPNCIKLYLDPRSYTKLHQTTSSCIKLHQTAPCCTNVHQTESSCTHLHQVAPNCTNLHQVELKCTKLHQVWNAVNEVCSRNSTSESVHCIISDGIQHTTPKSIALAMNNFFESIGKRLADKITTTWPSCNSSTDLPKLRFQLAELEESFVLQQLLALKTNKAISLDKSSARLLKNSAHTIALSVTKLLNLSIKTGKFPKLWKCSEITALFKSGDRTNASNYRPISILPTLSKILEKAVHSYTSSWLPVNSSQENSLDSRRDCPPYRL